MRAPYMHVYVAAAHLLVPITFLFSVSNGSVHSLGLSSHALLGSEVFIVGSTIYDFPRLPFGFP